MWFKEKQSKQTAPQAKVEHKGSPSMTLDYIDKLKTRLKSKF